MVFLDIIFGSLVIEFSAKKRLIVLDNNLRNFNSGREWSVLVEICRLLYMQNLVYIMMRSIIILSVKHENACSKEKLQCKADNYLCLYIVGISVVCSHSDCNTLVPKIFFSSIEMMKAYCFFCKYVNHKHVQLWLVDIFFSVK